MPAIASYRRDVRGRRGGLCVGTLGSDAAIDALADLLGAPAAGRAADVLAPPTAVHGCGPIAGGDADTVGGARPRSPAEHAAARAARTPSGGAVDAAPVAPFAPSITTDAAPPASCASLTSTDEAPVAPCAASTSTSPLCAPPESACSAPTPAADTAWRRAASSPP